MDEANPEKSRPLTPHQQLKHLMNEMAKAEWNDDRPLTPEERAEAREFGAKLLDCAKAYASWLDAGQPLWGETIADQRKRSEDGRDR